MPETEVIVIGAGVVGLSAAFELTRAGHHVTVLSADVPGSRQSAGRSRIFRLAHADGPLTDAAARSLELWTEWEGLAGFALLDRGGLLLTGDMADREIHLRRHGGLRSLTGAAHPLAVAWDEWGFETTGAAIRAEDTVRFLQRDFELVLAEAARVEAGQVTLSGGGRLQADRIVVCAGPDTYRLLGRPEPERLRSVRFSFAVREPLEAPPPGWIHRDARLCEPFYAVMDGRDHYSVGLSQGAPIAAPEAVAVREAHHRVLEVVKRALPGLLPVAERPIVCDYTLNPRGPLSHDGWDLMEGDGVIGLTGPSLFKFAPLLGLLVAQRVGGVAGDGIGGRRARRPGSDGRRTWLRLGPV